MARLSKPFQNWDNLFVFCVFGYFWVSNIGPLFAGNPSLMRLFIYPIYLLIPAVYFWLILSRPKGVILSKISSILVMFFLLLGCLCVARGISALSNIDDLRTFLFSRANSALVWLVPLSILFALKKDFWLAWLPRIKHLVFIGTSYVFIVMVLGVGTGDILSHKMYNSCDFLFLAPLLFIYSRYKKDSLNLIISYVGMIILVAWMFLVNERFAIAFAGLMYFFYLTILFFQKRSLNLKINSIAVLLTTSIITLVIITQIPIFTSYINRYIFQGEIMQDTRGGDSLRKAVTQGMSMQEQILGRGIFGKYTWGSRGWPPAPYVRINVEIGYMQLVLKGGYLMLVSFLLLSLHAVYLGIFRSRNKVTRYLAVIIIARLIIMSTAMPPRVGFEYFMYWLAIGGCLSIPFRALTDEQIVTNIKDKSIIIKW